LISPGCFLCCSGEGPAPSNEPKDFDVADLAGIDDGLKFGGD
jgi:hypothetical protein